MAIGSINVTRFVAILVIAFVLIKLVSMIAGAVTGEDWAGELGKIKVQPLFQILILGGAVIIAFSIIMKGVPKGKDVIVLVGAMLLLWYLSENLPTLLGESVQTIYLALT